MTKADTDFAEGKANTRKEWIETMISESKRKKAEKQRSLAETANLTADLDNQWREIWGTVRKLLTRPSQEMNCNISLRQIAM